MVNQKTHLLLACMISVGTLASAETIESKQNIFDLPLEELVNVTINTGSLFSASTKESPSAITVIERDKIELSGAKNLAHLLEQHVPGMILMTHSEGEKIGLRGHIAAENYKLLLLVNGKNVTNMTYEGVITEIDQWEMGDIERVEVVSGPGSVTYGTGAVAGVINIITKTSKDDLPNWSIGVASNDTYNSEGFNVQYSGEVDDWGVYGFMSYRKTQGLENPDYYKQNPSEQSDNRYVGKGETSSASPQEYQADSFDRPQIKTHIGINRGDNFSAWLRYTQSGQTHAFNEKNYKTDDEGNPIEATNYRNLETRSLIASADYRYILADKSSISTTLTLDSQEYLRYRPENLNYGEDSVNNIRQYAFSQDRATASFLYDVQASAALNIITGYEYSHIRVHAPWGKGRDHLWIKEGVDILSSVDSSVYLEDLSLNGRPDTSDAVEVGGGIRATTHTHLLESKYSLSDNQNLFYAHRLDFPDISDSMFSPRLSLVSTLNANNTLVSTVQRAQRMMPLRAQYLSEIAGNNSKNETLDSLEFSYTNTQLEHTSVNLRAYYNENNAVGFTGDNLEFLTEVKLFGLDFTSTYQLDTIELTFNHAYINPLDVTMNESLKDGTNRNNISFADYDYNTNRGIPLSLQSYGDGLNNWSTNTSKFLYTHSFFNQRLKAHINAQVHWDHDGSYDEMGMYQQAYNSFDRSTLSVADQAVFDEQYQDFRRERELLEEDDAYSIDYNVNASLTYLWSASASTDVQLKLYAENLLSSSKRYYVSTGSSNSYPNRLQYMEKPTSYGFSAQVSF